MQKIIGVRYKDGDKIYYFMPGRIKYNVGDRVVVDDGGAQMLGTVVFGEKDVDERDFDEPLKSVLRVATNQDEQRFLQNKDKSKNAEKIAREKIATLGLQMKVVSADYSLEGGKVIISFTAEDRVDFRELLKELASALRARIELKQIGQRDEVKIKGGIGPCGEICCCKRFLKDFEHVTVKMAKNQGLSLSPTKISGLCGRLMCCLGYENPLYEQMLSKMPKVGSSVFTPDGRGQVIYNDILREQVSVKFVNGDETVNIVSYPLENIKFEQKKENKNGVQNKSR